MSSMSTLLPFFIHSPIFKTSISNETEAQLVHISGFVTRKENDDVDDTYY